MDNKIKPMRTSERRANNIRNIAKHKAEAIAKAEREESRKIKRKKAAERKRQERSRYGQKGLISVTVRINPINKEKLYQYVEGLNNNDNC